MNLTREFIRFYMKTIIFYKNFKLFVQNVFIEKILMKIQDLNLNMNLQIFYCKIKLKKNL